MSGLTGGCGGCCGRARGAARAGALAAAGRCAALAAARRTCRAQLRQHLVAGGAERLPELLVVGAAGAAGRLPLVHLTRQRGLGDGGVERLDQRLGLLDQRALGGARAAALAVALGGHRAAAVEGGAAARREALPERLLLVAPGVAGGLPLGHQPLERIADRAPVVGGGERLGLRDQRLLALDRGGALARPLGVGAVALLVERLARGGEAPPQLAVAHLAGRGGRLPALEQIAEALGGLGVARRRGQALGLLGDRGAQHLGQRALVLAREHDLLRHLGGGRLLGGGLVARPGPRVGGGGAPRRQAPRTPAAGSATRGGLLGGGRLSTAAASDGLRGGGLLDRSGLDGLLDGSRLVGAGASTALARAPRRRPRRAPRRRPSTASTGSSTAGSSARRGLGRLLDSGGLLGGGGLDRLLDGGLLGRDGVVRRTACGLGLLGLGHLDGVRFLGGGRLLAHRLLGLGVAAIQTGLDHGCVRRLLGGRLHAHS